MNLIKAHGEKGSWPFSFERSATSPPQADHVLVDLFSSTADGGSAIKLPHTLPQAGENAHQNFSFAPVETSHYQAQQAYIHVKKKN